MMTAIPSPLRDWANATLAFFYPEVCQVCQCHRAGYEESYVCEQCLGQSGALSWIEPPFCEVCGLNFEGDITEPFQCSNCAELELAFDSARAAVALTDFIREIIHRYKYGKQVWFENFLARLLLAKCVPEIEQGEWNCIVPVPLHAAKEWQREFNQAERLGRQLARVAGLPLRAKLLKRVLPTTSQTTLTRRQRLENVQKAFAYAPAEPLAGENIILVDDIMTTGATTSACAAILKQNGAGKIQVWTVARGRLAL